MISMRIAIFGRLIITSLFAGMLLLYQQAEAGNRGDRGHHDDIRYELWASDQSNTVAGKATLGIDGSLLWIWDNEAIETQLDGGPAASPIPCTGTAAPCDTNLMFPATLIEHNEFNIPTGSVRPLAGRLHSAFIDPQQKYALLSFFAPGGGMIGVMDAETKESIALFRATQTGTGRTNHMSFWRFDGLAILVCNLDGRIVKRIDVTRDTTGHITGLTYNMNAALGVGKSQTVVEPPRVYLGNNALDHPLIGSIQAGAGLQHQFQYTHGCRRMCALTVSDTTIALFLASNFVADTWVGGDMRSAWGRRLGARQGTGYRIKRTTRAMKLHNVTDRRSP